MSPEHILVIPKFSQIKFGPIRISKNGPNWQYINVFNLGEFWNNRNVHHFLLLFLEDLLIDLRLSDYYKLHIMTIKLLAPYVLYRLRYLSPPRPFQLKLSASPVLLLSF